MKTFQDFLHLMDFIGNQTVQGPNERFSAASKGFKRHQTMNKSLIYCRTLRVMTRKKDLFVLMNEFDQKSHKRSKNRARWAFVL